MDSKLMTGDNDVDPYYYHLSFDYDLGCRQRIPYKDIMKFADRDEVVINI